MMSATEIELMGFCAFCEHHNHDFPDDKRHKDLHDKSAYHSCDVFGGFRDRKPLCEHMKLAEGCVFMGQ